MCFSTRFLCANSQKRQTLSINQSINGSCVFGWNFQYFSWRFFSCFVQAPGNTWNPPSSAAKLIQSCMPPDTPFAVVGPVTPEAPANGRTLLLHYCVPPGKRPGRKQNPCLSAWKWRLWRIFPIASTSSWRSLRRQRRRGCERAGSPHVRLRPSPSSSRNPSPKNIPRWRRLVLNVHSAGNRVWCRLLPWRVPLRPWVSVAHWLIDWLGFWLINCLFVQLIDWSIARLIDRLTDPLLDRLIDWLILHGHFPLHPVFFFRCFYSEILPSVPYRQPSREL